MSIFSTKDRADMTHIVVEENGSTLYIFEATMDDQGKIFNLDILLRKYEVLTWPSASQIIYAYKSMF